MQAWKLTSLAMVVASGSANALEPQGMSLGSGLTLLPSAQLSITDDDNIYKQKSDTTSSTIVRFKPEATLAADLGSTELQANVTADLGRYSEESDDDYFDLKTSIAGKSELTARNEIVYSATLNQDHDDRGSGTTEGSAATAVTEPDEYDETTFNLAYTYGADTALFNVGVYGEAYDKEYQNNRSVTADRDHDKRLLGARLGIRVSPATRAIAEIRNTDISYDNDSSISADGSETSYLVGSSWDITGTTTGEVKLGLSDREFDDADKDSRDTFTWEASVTYSPRSYSVFTLTTAQTANETNGVGNYIDSDYTSVNWKHDFSAFLSLVTDFSLANDEYVDDPDDRKDTTISYGLKGVLAFSQNAAVSFGYTGSNRDSEINDFDYDKNVVSVGLLVAL
ncbi:MAG: hypothetical protein CMI02_15075 [Oceanospirillaceae bacterium]|nr:hypothetical protein [Oceanospirillaceae bacterium]MBT13346.1 hypothetical protein [Oceanospirillaceae bacterium]|tara:strand:+ start:22801 stop:23988 length:1188 start_codon:yes stop_codon:yes gene_type:complete